MTVKFSDKERHQLFVEPESVELDTIYLQGFSTSMPEDVQLEMIHSLPGFENAKVKIFAYAIEYDAIDPLTMWPSLENKIVENLFTAGQINGTSGYEEAAAQGLMAGINASRKIKGLEPLVLRRDEAYIGVLIDDIVTKGVTDPYRMLTSRAEYRLLLRNDNADLRLRDYGYQVGLISEERYKAFLDKKDNVKKDISFKGEALEKYILTQISCGMTFTKEDIRKNKHILIAHQNEQTELTDKIQIWEQEIARQEEEADSIEQFIRRAKKYPVLTELTPAVLNDLVNKVYVCAPDKSSGHRVQDVRISLACIGFLPESIIVEMINHAAERRTA